MSSDCLFQSNGSDPNQKDYFSVVCITKHILKELCIFIFTVNSFVRKFEDKLVLWRSEFLLQLHYLRLPKDISEDYVILMDSTVSTGAAALMAVRVLLVSHLSSPVLFI